MKANAESSSRVHLTRAKTGVEQEELTVEDLESKVKELEEMKNNSDAKLEVRLPTCFRGFVWVGCLAVGLNL